MKFLQQHSTFNTPFYSILFLVTQVSGLLMSLVICYILQDFTWEFVRMALKNSFILGIALLGSCYLFQKLIFKVKLFYIALITFALVLGVGIISLFIVLLSEPTLFIYYDRGAFSFLFINFLFIIELQCISSVLIVNRELMVEKEKTIGNERNLKNQMELKLLSSRINPHFLFNTLNMIITLLKHPEKAEIAVLNLSDLLRENLDQSDKLSVPVTEELDTVRKYLELQKLRFGERLHYIITGSADFSIPPLLIQPLVENSIKHNMQNVAQLTITIELSCRDNRNSITVTDSVKAVRESMLDTGQGLTITRKRVENSNGTFTIKNGGIELSFGL